MKGIATMMVSRIGMVVLALGLWAAVHGCGPSIEQSDTKVREDLRHIGQGLAQYAADHGGRYPTTLAELITPKAAYPRTHAPNPRLPRDPWNRDYEYAPPSGRGRPDVFCYGADGSPGGSGADRDVHLRENGQPRESTL